MRTSSKIMIMASRHESAARISRLVFVIQVLSFMCARVSGSASYASVSFVTSVPLSTSTQMIQNPVRSSSSTPILSTLTSSASSTSRVELIYQLKNRSLTSSSSSAYSSSTTSADMPIAYPIASTEMSLNAGGLQYSYEPLPYFGDFFRIIYKAYIPVHGYLSLLVCIFGIFANILNIVVLTRKEMLSPTNAILTGLAMADLMVMIEYIPFAIHSSIEKYSSEAEKFTYPWAVFTLFHAHFSVIFHSISSWLTVILAIWRYTSVSFPTESKVWCSMKNAKITIVMTYIIVPILCIPLYLSYSIQPEIFPEERNITGYMVDFSVFSLTNDGLLKSINFWVFSVGQKIVPCILLTYLSLALIRVLLEAERRRQRLKSNAGATASHVSVASDGTACPAVAVASAITQASGHQQQQNNLQQVNQQESEDVRRGSDRSETSFACLKDDEAAGIIRMNNDRLQPDLVISSKREHDKATPPSSQAPSSSATAATHPSHHVHTAQKHHNQPPHAISSSSSQSDRTTKMLLAILLLYLVSEMPTGIVCLLVGLLGESFRHSVYEPLGEIFDILALINSGINFILLASMSRLFRKTFCKIFWPRKYHNHYQRDNPAHFTEKTNVNHTTIVRPNAGLLNQPALQQQQPATTSKFNSQQQNKIMELNQISTGISDQTTAVITVTEPSHHQDINDETTMV